jgi:hypothetical protein
MTAMAWRKARHLVVFAGFAAITLAWLWPFLASPATRIPGEGAGDNFLFVWNLWWTRHAVQSHVWPLWCPAIFVPFGVDLTLHTVTLLPTLLVALVSPSGSLIAGTNAIIAGHIFLNFAVAYALAWRMTRNLSAAFVGALLFGWSPYVQVRLLGHFNLIAAWTLPLTAMPAIDVLERPSRVSALWLAFAIATTTYVEYYYAVYAVTLVALLVCNRFVRVSWEVRIAGPGQRRALTTLVVCVAAACALAVAITLSGGFVLTIAGRTASFKSAYNPLAAASVFVVLGLVVVFVPGSTAKVDWSAARRSLATLSIAVLVATVLVSPLLISGLRVWMRGDYVSQHYLWRSAPAGVDAGTLLLGNPRGLIWRDWPGTTYRNLGIDEIEQTAWLSPGLLCLCVAAWRRRAELPAIRAWIAVGAVFGLWALGPYLVMFGKSLPIILPATLIRYVPIISNARVPSRAVALVYLAAAMLAANGFLLLRQRGRTAWAVVFAVVACVDLVPSRPPILNIERPAIYETLRSQPQPGAVCELPLGLRDSFGVVGAFDPWVLWHQTIHERGMAGGFVSRLPPRIPRDYLELPVLGSFLRLSAGGPLDAEPLTSPAAAAAALASDGIFFVLVDRVHSSPALLEYVGRLGLHHVAGDGERELLRVDARSVTNDRSSR